MPVYVQCPQCERKLGVPDNLLGKRVKCPSCQTVFTAEEPGGAAAPPPPPPPPDEERVPASRRRDEHDDDDAGEERGSRRRGGGDSEKARGMVSGPGIALLIHGILGLVASFLTIVLYLIAVVAATPRERGDVIPGAIFGSCDGLLSI